MSIQDAIRYTDAEILAEAMGDSDYDEGNPAYLNMPDSGGADDDLENTQGLDGEFLSDQEQFATNNGDVPEGYLGDRPLQFMHEQELMRELEWRRAGTSDNDQLNQEILAESNKITAEQRDQIANHFMGNGMNYDAAYQTADIMQGMDRQRQAAVAQVQVRDTNRLKASFEKAEQDYGDDFRERAKWLNGLTYRANGGDQVSRAIVTDLVNRHDPGAALMEWEEYSPHRPPPFMGGSRVLSSRSTLPARQNLTYEDLEASSAPGDDADIFNSSVGDSRDNPYWQNYGG
jgi:hypothetical protein